jgi:hypothetical protein
MNDYRNDMTLGDIKDNDTDMLEDAIKGAKRYTFDNVLKAKRFVKHCLDKFCHVALRKGATESV